MIVHAINHTQEPEVGELQFQGKPGIHTMFQKQNEVKKVKQNKSTKNISDNGYDIKLQIELELPLQLLDQ